MGKMGILGRATGFRCVKRGGYFLRAINATPAAANQPHQGIEDKSKLELLAGGAEPLGGALLCVTMAPLEAGGALDCVTIPGVEEGGALLCVTVAGLLAGGALLMAVIVAPGWLHTAGFKTSPTDWSTSCTLPPAWARAVL